LGGIILFKKMALFLVVSVFLTMALAGCGQKAAGTDKAKVLRVGAETTFPPFEFQDGKSKEYVGFDMDLARAIGKQMGYQVKIVSMGFDGLIPALQAHSIDMIASAMTITNERAKEVTFSNPYYTSGLSIVVKKDNNTIHNFKDLEGKRIAVQIGTTSADAAKKIKGAKVHEFNSTSEAYMELKAGGVDAVINDLPVNQYYIAKSGDKTVKLLKVVQDAEEYGMAVAKDNTKLAAKVNAALAELKKNGEYNKIYEKWFGKKPVE
jgi:polar amino acid transport system substrate-binding protein